MSVGILYLLPVPLGESGIALALPPAARELTNNLQHFIVEHPKTARHFLKQIGTQLPLQSLEMTVLDEHTPEAELENLLKPLLQGKDVGLMSEAGCPGIADPGAMLVALAHRKGIKVKPLVGPSSILLALMASGLEGQRFAFHGYLPTEKTARLKRIIELEKESKRQRQTQIFIETPYRNNALFVDLLNTLSPQTRVCVASDLTLSTEIIRTLTVIEWKKIPSDLNKHPTVFLFLS